MPGAPVVSRRPAALAAHALALAALVIAIVIGVQDFPYGLIALACLIVAAGAGWWGLLRRGAARTAGLGAGALLVAGSLAIVIVEGRVVEDVVVIALLVAALALARTAFATHVDLPTAPRPKRPVLFYNPRSGDGKAARFHLAEAARTRGVEAVELSPGDDLWTLTRDAVRRGADALGMAGGDGSQAIVAAVAADEGLPYVCVPAGTRNHFALDLGVDRDDVVGALDAFVDGGERVVDLAEVNGRIFVNNVSLGVYAEAVQQSGYRAAKLRTIAETVPSELGPGGEPLDLRWTGPDGGGHSSAAVILVSNDRYRLGRAVAAGTRPALDTGLLGIAVAEAGDGDRSRLAFQEWTAPSFEIGSGAPVAAGIDGEAARLDPPLRFRTHPRALRVRIAPAHPGASPSATVPEHPVAALRALARVALGRQTPAMTSTAPESTASTKPR